MNILILLLLSQLLLNLPVQSSKKCIDTFCGKLRKSPEGFPHYHLDLSTVIVQNGMLQADLVREDGLNKLDIVYYYLDAGYGQLQITDPNLIPLKFETSNWFNYKANSHLTLKQITNESVIVTSGTAKSILYSKPFKIESYFTNNLVAVINGNNRLVLDNSSAAESAAAIDITFHGTQQAYGIPLHADKLALRTTTNGEMDPYRLYHNNNGHYKLKSTEALHSSRPSLFTHGQNQSSGALFISYSQIWIDITHAKGYIEAYFMHDTPMIGISIFNGPTIADVVAQNKRLSGVPFIPPYFSLGYHQSRNSYVSEEEVLDVIEQFNSNNLPLESIWLDISHTDNGKYFTWHPQRFPDPVDLLAQLAVQNRSLVITIGPHFKIEEGYFIHDHATLNGFYIRNRDGSDYIGKCLPGTSSYYDFFNREAADYYQTLFLLKEFKSENLHMFLDLNEPTVFENEEYENTLPPDLLQFVDQQIFPHVYLHNVYSDAQSATTMFGLMKSRLSRPFHATRSHSLLDVYVAHTITGDNLATWEHLQISIPMCLNHAFVSRHLCGANIGGFDGIPDEELYQRWYQAGAWLPFYRSHFSANVPRREPYVFSEKVINRVRNALHQRYAHLPAWYTILWEGVSKSQLVIRPVFYHYPQEEATFTIDNEFLVGRDILVAPVLKRGAFIVTVYLPGGDSEIWYNIDDNYKALRGIGNQILYVNLDSVPVFYRGGSIIARKNTHRLTAAATVNDPYTLYICLDVNNTASGTLYVDDYKSFSYMTNSEFLYIGLSFEDNSFYAYKIVEHADYNGAAPIGEIVILNPPKNIGGVTLNANGVSSDHMATVAYNDDGSILTLSNLSLNIRDEFTLRLI